MPQSTISVKPRQHHQHAAYIVSLAPFLLVQRDRPRLGTAVVKVSHAFVFLSFPNLSFVSSREEPLFVINTLNVTESRVVYSGLQQCKIKSVRLAGQPRYSTEKPHSFHDLRESNINY